MQGRSHQPRRECRNAKCLHRRGNPGRTVIQKKYNETKFLSCHRCSPHVAKLVNSKEPLDSKQMSQVTPYIYCSQICLRQDWQVRHQFECQGSAEDRAAKKRANMLDPAKVQEIEKTTPFIKTGQLRQAGVVDDERVLANMKLDELEFEDKIIGKGSYGSV